MRPTVFVALSGGVDSSVAAALLKERGYSVTGVFIKVWQPEFIECPWREDRLDAMRVCARLGIPFLTFHFEEEYKRDVVDYMVEEYRAGRTPNPDVMCNQSVKFGVFLKKARDRGADFIATGHYARIMNHESRIGGSSRIKTPREEGYTLLTGADANKDQSYFLWTLTQEQLQYCLFPVGDYEKPDVRRMARDYGLETAEKKDSQGVCFLGKLDMRAFLTQFIPEKPGDVLDTKGEIIGYHDGATFLTIGERRGFTVTQKTPRDSPMYVISKNNKQNTITVGSENELSAGADTRVMIRNTHWINKVPEEGRWYAARGRYRALLEKCRVTLVSDERAEVVFDSPPRALAPGQSLVVYAGDTCLGGGIIE